jgi:hypothetical protein
MVSSHSENQKVMQNLIEGKEELARASEKQEF